MTIKKKSHFRIGILVCVGAFLCIYTSPCLEVNLYVFSIPVSDVSQLHRIDGSMWCGQNWRLALRACPPRLRTGTCRCSATHRGRLFGHLLFCVSSFHSLEGL